MGKCFIFVLIGAALAFWYVKNSLKGENARTTVMKATSSVCFIMAGVFGILVNPPAFLYGGAVVIGLVWSLLGDIWLDLKNVYPQDNERYLLTGFLSFAAAHFFYIMAMVRSVKPSVLLCVIAAVLSVAAGVANGTVFQKYLKVRYGEYQTVVIFYGSMLAATFFFSLICIIGGGVKYGGLWMVLAGAFLFMISDLILARTYFGKRHNKPVDVITNYATYYAAQCLIALSVAAMK